LFHNAVRDNCDAATVEEVEHPVIDTIVLRTQFVNACFARNS
jgi:hypothetical protein